MKKNTIISILKKIKEVKPSNLWVLTTKKIIIKSKYCLVCGSIFHPRKTESKKQWNSRACCSRECADKNKINKPSKQRGIKRSKETIEKIRIAGIGRRHTEETKKKIKEHHFWTGRKRGKQSPEHIEKIRQAKLGKTTKAKGVPRPQVRGEKNWKWIEDRTKLKRYTGCEERRSPAYKSWVKEVKDRDGWKCRVCGGKEKLRAHHIIPFRESEELKYNTNNGITPCKTHHPIKRDDEIRLIPYFQGLVEVKSNNLSTKQNDAIVEELKQQLDTALDMKDFERAKQINQDIIDIAGYGVDYDIFLDEDPNYED